MDLSLMDFWRLDGPGHLRFVMQPLFAVLLGIRDGRRDAKAGVAPYVYRIIFDSPRRRESLKEGLMAIAVSFAVAIIMDGVIQYDVHGIVHPVAALVVGGLLVASPYLLLRGLVCRIMQRRQHGDPGPGRAVGQL